MSRAGRARTGPTSFRRRPTGHHRAMVLLIILAAVVLVALGVLVLPGLGPLGIVIGVVALVAILAYAVRVMRRPDVAVRETRERTEALPVGPRVQTDDADVLADPDRGTRERAREIQG